MSDSLAPHGLVPDVDGNQPTRFLCPRNSRDRILEWVAIPFSRDLPYPEIEPRSPVLKADSLPPEPPEKLLCVCVCVSGTECDLVLIALLDSPLKSIPGSERTFFQDQIFRF